MILFACLIAMLAPVLAQVSSCEEGWVENPGSGSCYKVVLSKRSWEASKNSCEAMSSELASVQSTGENEFLYGLLKNYNDNFWLGGNDIEAEGTWVWQDGSPVSFTYWGRIEPNDERGNENCMLWWTYTDGHWNDANCVGNAYSVCEKSVVVKCGEDWTEDPNTGACYQIVLEKLDWLAAREKCRSLNAESYLASIHSNQENEFVQALLRQGNGGYSGYWIGGEGAWVWTDGSQVTINGLNEGQVNQCQNNCLAMWKGFDYKWKNVKCDKKHAFVCKIEN